MMFKFMSEAKPRALFYNRLMRRSGILVAVLLVHFLIWIGLKKEHDLPPPRQNASIYSSVMPIVLNDSSGAALKSIKNKLKDISPILSKPIRKKQDVTRLKEVSEKKIMVPVAPDASASQAKLLDYDEMKRIALSVAHEPRSRFLPGGDKKISGAQKFADAIDHAKRGDCRSEHAYLGILAIPFLLKDTLTGDGCKW